MEDENEKKPPKETEITIEFVGHEEEGPAEVPSGGEALPDFAEGAEEMDREARLAELQDLYLRQRADFVNFKRRVDRERDAQRRDAAAEAARRILPVLDNFDRALQVLEGGDHPEWFQGFALVRQQLWEALRSLGVEEIEAEGRAFDPAFHEAMLTVRREGLQPGMVAEVLERGYRMGEKVLKPARVSVAAPEGGTEEEQGEGHV
jgi:molecular chaperone GrpE